MKKIILVFIIINTFIFADIFKEIKNGNTEYVKRILKESNYKQINKKDKYGLSLLHIAAHEGEIELVKFLIKHGINIDVVDNNNCTPLKDAVMMNEMDIVKFLVGNGADIKNQDKEGKGLLHYAREKEVLLYLLDLGLNPNQKDIANLTPLFGLEDKELIEILLQNGADINVQDSFGRTPLIYLLCSETPNIGMFEFFVEHGLDLNIQTTDGDTALMFWIKRLGDQKIAKYLIKEGTDILIVNKDGEDALSLSIGAYGASTPEDPYRPGENELRIILEKMKEGK